MAEHRKQILAAFAFLLLLGVAYHLRVTGMGWSLPGGYHHPDERGIIMDTERIRWQPVARKEGESLIEYIQRAAGTNLRVDSPLNPRVFHYGSFPYYLMAGTKVVFEDWRKPVDQNGANSLKQLPGTAFYSIALFVLVLAIFYQFRFKKHRIPPWLLTWLVLSAVFWMGAVFYLHQPANLEKTYSVKGGWFPYLPFFISLALSVLPAFFLLLNTWRQKEINPKASLARLRIVFILLMGSFLTFLFARGLPTILETRWNYPTLGYIGRTYSVLAGLGTIALVYAFGSRCYNRIVGFMAAAFLSLAVLHIQLCHYSAFDVHLAFFIMLALTFFERVISRGLIWDYIFAGVAVGMAIATKFSAVTLPALFALPWILQFLSIDFRGECKWKLASSIFLTVVILALLAVFRQHHILLIFLVILPVYLFSRFVLFRPCHSPSLKLVRWASGLVLAFVVGFSVLYLLQPFCFIDSKTFWRSIHEQQQMVTGEGVRPFTIQYLKTMPFFYLFKQLLARGFGFPLGLLVLLGWLYVLIKQFRRGDRASLLLLAWTIPSFFVYGRFSVKYPRYLVTILPQLCLFGAILMHDLLRDKRLQSYMHLPIFFNMSPKSVRRTAWGLLILILVTTTIYAFGFVQIYLRPHTWVTASEWIFDNVPRGSKILCEHWDNDLPLGLPKNNRERMAYRHDTLQVYNEPDNVSKIRKMSRQLAASDYVILPTKRGYGSILRAPERFPYTSNYYKALFSGYIGFEPVKVVAAPAKFLGFNLYDDLIDESLRVYDHPKVVVFKKVEELPAEQIEALIINPADWVTSIRYEEILSLRDGLPVYAKAPRYPILRWYLCLQLIALVFFPICFPLTRSLRDGGWSLARPAGILLLAYSGWLLSSLKLLPFSGLSLWLILVLYLLLSFGLYRRYKSEIVQLIKDRWCTLLFEEIIWLVVLALFLVIRMNNPAIYWGEKPMDMSFVASAYRTDWFPPMDPWFSGNVINYYYYGHVVIASLGMLAGEPIQYLYNLAVATLPALSFLGAFGILFSLTRKPIYGLLGGYLTTIAGNLFGYLQMAKNLSKIDPSLHINPESGSILQLLLLPIRQFMAVVSLAWETIKLPLGWSSKLQGVTEATPLHRQIGFDSYFWKCGHDLIPHTVANEFPLWTYLFADLHAHLIVMPFTILFIGLALALFRSGGRALHPEDGRPSSTFFSLLIPCITLGTIFTVNPWDFPTSALLLFAILILKWWKFRPMQGQFSALLSYQRTLASFGIATGRLRRLILKLYLFLVEVLAPTVSIIALSILLYLPFHIYFHPRVPLGPGSVLLSLGNMTLVSTWLKIFGVSFFLVLSSLLYRWQVMPNLKSSLSRQPFAILLTAVVGLCAQFWLPWKVLLWPLVLFAILCTIILQLIDRRHRHLGRWTGLMIFSLISLAIAGTIRENSDIILKFLSDTPILSSLIYLRPHFKDILFDYSTAAFLLPLWLVATCLLIRWCNSRTDAFRVLLAWMGLSLAIGVECVFIKEGWEHPAHRYNTVFKFFLQIWTYLALGAAAGLYAIRHLRTSKDKISLWSPLRLFKSVWLIVLGILLIASAMFPIFGTYAVVRGPGARCVKGPRPDIDGWKYLSQGRSHAEFKTIHWVNRFIEGQPNLLEDLGLPYIHESSRISTNTGVPSLIGWDHHIRERTAAGKEGRHNQEIQERKRDVQQIYRKQDKRAVLNLLVSRGIDLLYVGSRERSQYSRDIQKFMGYGDALDLIFHTQGSDLYRVRKNLNEAMMKEATPLPAPGEKPIEAGVNMYIGGNGFDNGNFKEPRGLCVDKQGRTYVADTFNHRVQVFDEKGNFLFLFGEEGDLDGQMKEPNDVVITNNGNILVIDTWNHRLQVFSPKGAYQYQINAGFYGPRGLTLDQKGRIYVADTGNGRIALFTPDGKLIRQWGSRGSGPDQMLEPIGIAVSNQGEIFVVDTGNSRMQVFNDTGKLLRSWSLKEKIEQGQGNECHLSINPTTQLLYVSDPRGGKIHVYKTSGQYVTNFAKDGGIRAPIGFPVGLTFHTKTKDLMWCEQQMGKISRLPEMVLPKK